ncbi:tuftelin-interacting protein 11 [Bacillus rossius redtenbacheri]|uniref:tuftelin-interacting protein 11 n=1 Tax=Bacillus rossius redtenbacheri TaxID=93214 RepID=UPI002FDD65D3
MADEEVMKFEITDYDLDNEFNINRPTRKTSKNQQIYGIWAEDSGDEDDAPERPRAGFGGQRGKARHNYTAPVSFVAGGVQQAGKKRKQEEEEAKDSAGGKEDADADAEGSRSRFPFSKKGIRDNSLFLSSDEEDEDEVASQSQQQSKNKPFTFITEEIAGLRKKKIPLNPVLINQGVGGWEKHTKGIGAKLLLQMGFQPGKGLGRELQGIQAPVEAHLRKGRGAIGAYGPEKVAKITDVKGDSDEEEAKDFVEKLSQWRKADIGNKKKVRYVYKSVDDVLEQGKFQPVRRDHSQLSKVKVIDMTGPEQRVLSGYHAISGQQRPTDEWEIRKDKKFSNFALPELLHNINLLMDMCEQDIIHNDQKLRYSSDRMVTLEHEEANLSTMVNQEKQHIKTLETVLDIVQDMINCSTNETDPLTLDSAATAFKELQTKYYEEYRLFEIGDLAVTLVDPLICEQLVRWNPLQRPDEPLALFRQWQEILQGDDAHTLSSLSASQSPYHKLLWSAWMPSVRIAVDTWNCRVSEPLVDFLKAWAAWVPPWILDNIREQLVLPKLQREVEEWNPMTDTVPIHAWTHPWLSFLGNRLETVVFPVIRHKLSKALTSWHPSDRSARLMLLPWHKVFIKGEMDAFLVKNIVPKLQLALQEFVINPHEQHLDQWTWVMEWEDLLPVHIFASLLEKNFFPKWLQILTLWLSHAPNYDEITNWYMGWKKMFSEKLLMQPGIKEQFHRALELMNRAVSCGGQAICQQPGAIESVSYLTNIEQTQQQAHIKERESRLELLAEAVRSASQIPQGFRELIQKRCEERGLLFVPLPNRYREGKQVYRCGKIQIYIDRNVVFASDNGTTWFPKSLANVLDMAM